MTQERLDALQAEEESFRLKLAEIAQKKKDLQSELYAQEAEARRLAELEREITVEVRALAGVSLLIRNYGMRSDYLKVLQATPGRTYQRDSDNLIPAHSWPFLKEELKKLPNLIIAWLPEAEEDYLWFVNAAPWSLRVELDGSLRAKPGPLQDRYILQSIPNAWWDIKGKEYRIPLLEGWRVVEALKDIPGVVFEEESEGILIRQIEKRNRLNEIAAQEDTDWEDIGLLTWDVYSPRERRKMPFKEALLPYQKVGIEFGHATGGRYVNGDDTGLGKTWEGIGLAEILRLKSDVPLPVLVVCKAANIPNWRREIANLTREQKGPVECLSGTPGSEAIQGVVDDAPYFLISWDTLGKAQKIPTGRMLSQWNEERQDFDEVPETNDIHMWPQFFLNAGIKILLCDESHQAKSERTQRFKAWRQLTQIPHIIPMSASPVLNRTGEWWTSLYMIDSDSFPSKERFLNQYTWDGARPKDVDHLHQMLRPIFLRRRKTEVFKDLPPINRIYEECEISDRGKKLYNKALDGLYTKLAEFDPKGFGGQEQSIMGILAQITRLKQICAVETTEYTADLAVRLVDSAEENEDPKVLIFSQFKGTALAIANKLGHEAVCTVERTRDKFRSMTAEERDALFESARHDPLVKFVVTTKAAQEGHNIEYCQWTIFNEPFWGPKEHEQCEGRAYGRASNPHPIDSYYVTAKMDIIQWLTEMIADKAKIVEEVVEGVASSRTYEDSVTKALIKRIRENSWKRR